MGGYSSCHQRCVVHLCVGVRSRGHVMSETLTALTGGLVQRGRRFRLTTERNINGSHVTRTHSWNQTHRPASCCPCATEETVRKDSASRITIEILPLIPFTRSHLVYCSCEKLPSSFCLVIVDHVHSTCLTSEETFLFSVAGLLHSRGSN